MASGTKRIRHVWPTIAQSITTPFRTFKINSRKKGGERQYQLSLRLAEPSRAQTLKKQAVDRGAPAAAAADMSNMG